MSDDPVEDIADAMTTFLTNADYSAFTWKPIVIKTYTPDEFLYTEQPELKLLIVPYGETAQKAGRGGQALEFYQVNLIVVKRLAADPEIKALNKLTRGLKPMIRPNRMAGYAWSTDETISRVDPKVLQKMTQFASLTRFSYVGTS